MSKPITEQAYNNINVIGKLLDVNFATGKLPSDGREYERATMTIRVNQTYPNGLEETSEIPVSMFAAKYKKDGNSINPGYENLQQLKKMKTAQNNGIDNADTISLRNGNIRENNFISRNSGSLISGWQIGTSFVSASTKPQIASFALDVFIMDMHDELDREGDTTGRLIVKGGIVQYNGKLDVLEFIVEDPEGVEYFSRILEVNQTARLNGRIRVTSKEVNVPASNTGWGEVLETTTRTVRELILTGVPEGGPRDEDVAYDQVDIRKAFQIRKAEIEQMQLDAKKTTSKPEAQSGNKYDWQ